MCVFLLFFFHHFFVLYFSFFFWGGYCRSGIHQIHFVLVLFTFLHLLIYKLNLNQKNIVHVHEVHTFHFKHYPIGSICVGLMILGLFVTLNITAFLFFFLTTNLLTFIFRNFSLPLYTNTFCWRYVRSDVFLIE